MMEKLKISILLAGLIFVSPLASLARMGVTGVGNTNDISFQFDFAKTTAIQILKNVTPEALLLSSNEEELKSFYQACRLTMYKGALATDFVLVSNIDDGGGLHALAKRANTSLIEINRPLMESLQRQNMLSMSSLTSIMLHEVGHDCTYRGRPVDDSFDALLNKLALKLMQASNDSTKSDFLMIDFVYKVNESQPVDFLDLPRSSQIQIIDAYLNYLGDWVYYSNKPFFVERPQWASLFEISPAISLAPSWSSVLFDPRQAELVQVQRSILKSVSETKKFLAETGGRRLEIANSLRCTTSPELRRSSSVQCSLNVDFKSLGLPALRSYRQKVDFTADVFNKIQITKIESTK